MSTNPYETYAHDFIRHRGGQPKGIGQKTVRRWADQLPQTPGYWTWDVAPDGPFLWP
ncbi:MAG: hypothetical protein ACO3MZ_00215 [Flavobacteriaceae bacterium]